MSVKSATKRGTCLLMAPLALAVSAGGPAHAEEIKVKIPDTTLTASMRASFTANETDDPAVPNVNDFALNSVNIYLNSKITEKIKFSFTTEISNTTATTGVTTTAVTVQDAIAQFEFDPKFNIWAGRLLAPTDRANSYGPYYANNWNFANDGAQDGYFFIDRFGRADGVAYWGDFAEKVKFSAGVFDIPTTLGTNDVMGAARLQVDLWDFEPGYYLNGTYLGDKDILAFAVATNAVNSTNATNFDFLMEKKVGNGGAFTLEGEYIKYNELGGYPLPATSSVATTDTVNASYTDGDSWYLLASYLMAEPVGPGKLQLLGKFGTSTYDAALASGTDLEMDTTEVNLNYIVKSFNCRVSLFYLDKAYSSDAAADTQTVGLGVQLMTL